MQFARETWNLQTWVAALTMAVLDAIPIMASLFYNIHYLYITTSGEDIVYFNKSLRLNSGMPQHYHGHTGYVLFVLLTTWLKLMHLFGITALHQLPARASDEFVTVIPIWSSSADTWPRRSVPDLSCRYS